MLYIIYGNIKLNVMNDLVLMFYIKSGLFFAFVFILEYN